MRKDALTTTLTTLVIGIFGAFLRWLQIINAFEEDTHLAIPGASTSLVFLVYSILAVVVFIVMSILWLRRSAASTNAEEALLPRTAVPTVLGWVAGVIAAIGCVKLMFSADATAFPTLTRIFAAAGIVMAPCLPMLFPGRGGAGNPGGRLAGVYVTLFACFWLVYCYRTNAENPVIWLYGIEILAICSVTLAYYYTCAYHYGRSSPRFALLALQLGAYFSLTSLFAAEELCSMTLFASCAIMMLTLEFLLVQNLKDKTETQL